MARFLGCRNHPGKQFLRFSENASNQRNSRWLIAHEYEDEAFTILADLENKSEDDPFILTQHKEIVYTVQYERQHAVKWMDLLRGKTGDKGGTKTLRRLILGAGTQAMQQLSGKKRGVFKECGNVTDEFIARNQRYKLLPTHCSNPVRWSRRKDGSTSCCL